MPNLSVSIPNLAPQNISLKGISTLPPCARPSNSRCATFTSLNPIDNEIGPSPYSLPGCAPDAMNENSGDVKVACMMRWSSAADRGCPDAQAGKEHGEGPI